VPSKHSVLQSVSVVLDANVNSASSVLQLFDSVRGDVPVRLRRFAASARQTSLGAGWSQKNGQPTGLA